MQSFNLRPKHNNIHNCMPLSVSILSFDVAKIFNPDAWANKNIWVWHPKVHDICSLHTSCERTPPPRSAPPEQGQQIVLMNQRKLVEKAELWMVILDCKKTWIHEDPLFSVPCFFRKNAISPGTFPMWYYHVLVNLSSLFFISDPCWFCINL